MTSSKSTSGPSRRDFLKQSAAITALTTMAGLSVARDVHAAGSDVLKVGLVGCGGRGSGAAVNALDADPNTQLVAMADLFSENIQISRQNIQNAKGSQVAVTDDHCFTGFDSCQRLIESGVDVVLLALPTYFHPIYLKACVDAGKHVFCEKTHAVDAPGVRMVLAAGEVAQQKNLSIVSGLKWRYDTGAQETMKRVHDGAIGEIVAIEEVCNTGSLRCRPRQPGWTEMKYQLQDWFDFTWLSADLPGLNAVHGLDKAAWLMHDEPPTKCWGIGGRQTRVGPDFGDVWDHHATVFEYAGGVRMYALCRQQDGCVDGISDRFFGAKGRCDLSNYRIEGENSWRYGGPRVNHFELEHVALFSAIRNGTPLNNSLYMARSSMLALMCTWASYTGGEITWEQAMKSEYVAAPKALSFDADPPTKPDANGKYPQPIPGVTQFV